MLKFIDQLEYDITLPHIAWSVDIFIGKTLGCCGSVDKTKDSQSWGPVSNLLAAAVVPFKLGQGTLSSLPSPLDRT